MWNYSFVTLTRDYHLLQVSHFSHISLKCKLKFCLKLCEKLIVLLSFWLNFNCLYNSKIIDFFLNIDRNKSKNLLLIGYSIVLGHFL